MAVDDIKLVHDLTDFATFATTDVASVALGLDVVTDLGFVIVSDLSLVLVFDLVVVLVSSTDSSIVVDLDLFTVAWNPAILMAAA